ncbi:MAG: hypothetical protein K0S32_3538 [Bacteroidetes bacterium]|jgi:hypothetical protein|nr:hypothetical protein [Bacteroidota bacterium]
MKKILFPLFVLFAFTGFPQHDSLWLAEHPIIKLLLGDTSNKNPGLVSVNVSQTALSDWQGGGENNFSITSLFKYDPIYKRENYQLTNKVDAQYGLIKLGLSPLRKNIDRLFALSKVDIKAFNSKYWFYSLQGDFRTQFAPGYTYVGDSIVGRANSDIMSPGYVQLALGMDFKMGDYFSITFAPVAGKGTFVSRQHLADEGAFGVEAAKKDSAGNIITPGKRNRFEFGGRIVLKFKKEITKSIALDSYVDLFSNYGNNPGNIDVVVNNTVIFKITRYFTASIISQLLYDDDIITKRDWDKDGLYTNPSDINGPRLQALTTFAFGFAYKF